MHVDFLHRCLIHVAVLFDRPHQFGNACRAVLDLPDQLGGIQCSDQPRHHWCDLFATEIVLRGKLLQIVHRQPCPHKHRRKPPALLDVLIVQPCRDRVFAVTLFNRVENGQVTRTGCRFQLEGAQCLCLFRRDPAFRQSYCAGLQSFQRVVKLSGGTPSGGGRVVEFVANPAASRPRAVSFSFCCFCASTS